MTDGIEALLASLHAGAPQPGLGGASFEIDESTRISDDEGRALHLLASQIPARRTLEVGLAYGFSTAYLLGALDDAGGGHHTAIDPHQLGDWHDIGVHTAARAIQASVNLDEDSFTVVRQRSEIALARMQSTGAAFDLVFIDGYHRFDDVLVDFTLASLLVPVGGVIVLHDMWLESIACVASFIRANRVDFAEISTGCDNLFAVRRVGDDERNWDHFASFT